MTKMKRIICGILLLSFCLSSVSCKKKKEVFTHESIVSAAKSYSAEAQFMYDNTINRMTQFQSCHPRQCTIFLANDETNARTSWVFIEKRT